MDRFGFIHEKLDIKLLILFILRRLPSPVSFENLSDLVMVDEGFDYFEYSQCLAELVETGQVEQDENRYKITKIGAENEEVVESSIPYSVRAKAERRTEPIITKMKRDNQISASHEIQSNGLPKVKLSLSDGLGSILSMSLLVSSEEQAKNIEKNFRSNAESFYHKIIKMLTEKNK